MEKKQILVFLKNVLLCVFSPKYYHPMKVRESNLAQLKKYILTSRLKLFNNAFWSLVFEGLQQKVGQKCFM